MASTSEQEEATFKANTAQHEKILSEASKDMVGGLLDLAAAQMNFVLTRLSEAGATDPLSLERFIHNADMLTQMANRTWDLSEKAYNKSQALFQEQKDKGQ